MIYLLFSKPVEYKIRCFLFFSIHLKWIGTIAIRQFLWLHFYSAFLSSVNILPNISVSILLEEESHKGLERHEKKKITECSFLVEPLMVIDKGLEVIICVFVCRLYRMSSVFGGSHKIAWGYPRSKINMNRKAYWTLQLLYQELVTSFTWRVKYSNTP